ncbi:unnamed protein product [Brassica oleracea]
MVTLRYDIAKRLVSLKVVDLSDFVAGRPEVEALDVMDLFSNALQGSNLSSLNLSDKALGDRDGVRAFAVADALKESASPVEVLEMAGNDIIEDRASNDITVEADSAIAACVAAKRDLNKLNLSENELKDEGYGAVALAGVVMKKEAFKLLNIDGNIISEEGVEEVKRCLRKSQSCLGVWMRLILTEKKEMKRMMSWSQS